ncbi:hypothetical protein L484_025183 [Morus notabilis]|uniref:Uncharacterized protein n=1 Tax=Morus notabilis TaxID=981085 RepID=W9RL99_9ROSA|nr:hypothetical protein L484_025183 [Morus notabilis]
MKEDNDFAHRLLTLTPAFLACAGGLKDRNLALVSIESSLLTKSIASIAAFQEFNPRYFVDLVLLSCICISSHLNTSPNKTPSSTIGRCATMLIVFHIE